MAIELQELFTSIWQFIIGNLWWLIPGVLVPLLIFYFGMRSDKWKRSHSRKDLLLKQDEFRSRDNNRIFWRNAAYFAVLLFFLIWIIKRK